MRKLSVVVLLFLVACGHDDSHPPEQYERHDKAYPLDINLTGSLQNPAFSPDGESILLTRFRNGYNQGPADLYIYNLKTKALQLLVSDGSDNVNLPGSTWNAMTSSIVFSSSRDPHDEIYIIAEDGENASEAQITNRTDRVAYEPSFSPDGQWVVFESHPLDVEDKGVIFKYKIDGTSSYIQLSDSSEDCRQPNWSPGGDKILYQKYNEGQWDIWTMASDGTNHIQLTSGDGDKTDASFTQDGLFIVFSSDAELEYANLYKISSAGGKPQRLSFYDGYDGAPSISSNNSKLVFESYAGDPDESKGTAIWMIDDPF